jgi:hypothetical protein
MDVRSSPRSPIPDPGGWKAHGRADGSLRRDRSTKVGYDYLHSIRDDHSRYAYTEVLGGEKGTTCADSSNARSPTSPPTASPRASG